MKRVLSLALASICGVVAAAGAAWVTFPDPRPASSDDWSVKAAILEVCCVFFGATYWSGRVVARVLGAPELAREIRVNARWHMGSLHLVLGGMIIFDFVERMKRGGSQSLSGVMIAAGIGLALAGLFIFLRGPRTEA